MEASYSSTCNIALYVDTIDVASEPLSVHLYEKNGYDGSLFLMRITAYKLRLCFPALHQFQLSHIRVTISFTMVKS